MELTEAMRTQNACRHYRPEPVPDGVLYKAVDAARFGPQGGNRQPVRLVIVRDPEKKRQLAEWYLVPWKAYLEQVIGGTKLIGHAGADKAIADADHFAEHYAEHPAIVVICGRLEDLHPTDTELDRLSVVGGGSIYPIVQNFCLALRDQGVATAITTLLCAYEPQVKELLDVPDEFATAAHVVVGYPANGFPTKLTRMPVEDIAFVDTFGEPLRQP